MLNIVIYASQSQWEYSIQEQLQETRVLMHEELQIISVRSLPELERILQKRQPLDLVIGCGSQQMQDEAAAMLSQYESRAVCIHAGTEEEADGASGTFQQALSDWYRRIQMLRNPKIIFRLLGSGIQVIDFRDILYIESTIHVQKVYLRDDTMAEVRQTLVSIRELLDRKAPGKFVSPSKGFLVNQDMIRGIRPTHIEVAHHTVPLAKGRFRQFQERYLHYIFGHEAELSEADS